MNTQIVNQPFLYANNLQVSNNVATPNTKIDIAAGAARDSTNSIDIILTASTLDATINGAGGLDTGDLAAETWYAIHVIGSSTNTQQPAVLLSTSATAPIMPTGYDAFLRIGWILTDASSHFQLYKVYGNGGTREYRWDAIISVLNAEGNTSYTAASMVGAVAPTSNLVILNYTFTPLSDVNTALLRRTGSTATSNMTIQGVAAKDIRGQLTIDCNNSQSIDYKTTSASDDLSLKVVGFTDFI